LARLRAKEEEEKPSIPEKTGAMQKLSRDMPSFTKQDRPAKVKEIYRALKRDHPDMPAEMKARIAARQGKKGKQKQGPPYKGPLTKQSAKKQEKSPLKLIGTLAALPLVSAATGAGISAPLGFARHGTKGIVPGLKGGAGIGAAIGVGAAGLIGLGALLQKADPSGKMIDTAVQLAPAVASVAGMATQSETFQKAHSKKASLEKQANLNIVLGHLWAEYGPGELEKHAAGSFYFYRANKTDRDRAALGVSFCKVATAVHKDPWDLARDVVTNFRGLELLAKTASSLDQRELAQFYMDWADEMEK